MTVSAQQIEPNKRGLHLLLDDGRNHWPIELWPEHMTYARQAVGEWGYVTQLVRSDDLDPARWQVFMDLCAELHLTPIMRLATTYDFDQRRWNAPPIDPDGSYQTLANAYAEFIAALEWPTASHYITVGNEPNHGNEWGGTPDPAAYARFLIDVANAIHLIDATSVVMNAGFDHYAPNTGSIPFADGSRFIDAESFMDDMVAAYPDVFTVIDAWASHAYPLGAFREPPWEQLFQIDYLHDAENPNHLTPPDGIYNRGINSYEWELLKLARYNVPEYPVFITETGWRHAETTDPNSADRGRSWPEAETVALYIELALYGSPDLTGWIPWQADPRVQGVTFFALNGSPNEWGHTNWLKLDSEGEILGTYPAFDLLATKDK